MPTQLLRVLATTISADTNFDLPGAHLLHTQGVTPANKPHIWYLSQVDALNSTQLNSYQQLFSGYIRRELTFVNQSKWLKMFNFQLISSDLFSSSKRIFL